MYYDVETRTVLNDAKDENSQMDVISYGIGLLFNHDLPKMSTNPVSNTEASLTIRQP